MPQIEKEEDKLAQCRALVRRYREATTDADARKLEPALRALFPITTTLCAQTKLIRSFRKPEHARVALPAIRLPPIRVYRLGDAADAPTEVFVGSTSGDIGDRIARHFREDDVVTRRNLRVRLPLLTDAIAHDRALAEELETMANMVALGVRRTHNPHFAGRLGGDEATFHKLCQRLGRCRRCGRRQHAGPTGATCLNPPFTDLDRPLPPF